MFNFSFGPKLIEQKQSKYSGTIRVLQGMGYKYISTGILTQSGGLVKDVWEGVLKKYGAKNKTWLILGLAGGTIADDIYKKLSPSKVVGVEIDPIMIEFGKKYLTLAKLTDMEIVVADAKNYIQTNKTNFDYILVDMYYGDKLPEFVYSKAFLSKLRAYGKTVIFNHLFYDSQKKQLAEKLVSELKNIFPSINLVHKLTNLLIICS
jgi:spermidine synthase